jgi:hypothetical protein
VLALWETSRSAASVTEDSPESVLAFLAQPGSVLLSAWERDALLGTLLVGWDGWRGNMYRLALVEAGHSHLRSLGARRVTALVGTDQSAAVALWQAAGYTRDDRIDRFVRNL